MFRNSGKHLFSLVTLFLVSAASFGQTTESGSNPVSNKQNSPYSRYGFGELRSGTNISLRGMGSISAAAADSLTVNADNPASYTSLQFTTYELAGEANSHTLKSGTSSYATGMATLSYMNLGMRVGKHFGLALGLRPTTRVYYNVQDSAVGANSVPGIGDAIRIYFGDGSVSQAYLGFAGRVEGLSVGFNLGYMFGSIRNTSALLDIEDTTNALNTEISRYTRVGGLFYKIGAQYEAKLSNKLALRVGLTGSASQSISAERNTYYISYLSVSGTTLYDTANTNLNVKGNIVLPMTLGGGVQLMGNRKWKVGLDYTHTQWGQFRNFGNTDSLQASAYRFAAGAELVPDAENMRKFWPRVAYRVGFSYGKDLVYLRNTDMNQYSVTLGMTMPFHRKRYHQLHTALEFGSRGTVANGLIKENYVKFTMGLSLNALGADKWFVKRKLE